MKNKHPNNHPQHQSRLSEGLEFKDMVGMMKPTIHVDEFSSKMGDDDDIIVVSFFVRSKDAARDLKNWFEKGYDWVLDADQSPGEIRPGRYLVYVEMRRRSTAGEKIAEALNDLSTLTEYENDSQWHMHYEDQSLPFSVETFNRLVPLSPKQYRERSEKSLNEIRAASGLETRNIYQPDKDLRDLQNAAGI